MPAVSTTQPAVSSQGNSVINIFFFGSMWEQLKNMIYFYHERWGRNLI